MESVLEKIRQPRNESKKITNINETTIDGCSVKMRFDPIGDNSAMTAIQSMLLSAYLGATLIGGECV